MRQIRLKQITIGIFASLLVLTVLLAPIVVSADNASISTACSGLDQLPDGSCANNGAQAATIANQAVKLLSIAAGIIAVVMLIVAGFQYITSGGDSAKVGKAKTAIVYTLISLFIVAITQFLVHVVLTVTK